MPGLIQRSLLPLACATALSACATTSALRAPLDDFAKASAKALEVTPPYFATIVADARRHAFSRAYLDPSIEVADAETCGSPPPPDAGDYYCFFAPRFDEAKLGQVVAGLDAAKAYAEIIAKLASADTVAEGQKGAKALGESLGAIATELSSDAVGGAVGSLASILGRIAVERERGAALRIAVEDGGPALARVLDAVAPAAESIAEQKRLYLDQEVLQLRDAYELRVDRADQIPFPEAERLALLARLESAVSASIAYPDASPATLLLKMKTAHEALVQAVQAGPRASPEAFQAAVAEFSGYVEEFAKAVAAYQKAEG